MKPCGILPPSPLPTSYLWDGQIKNETHNPYAMVPKAIWSGKGLDKLFKIVLPSLLCCCPIPPASLYLRYAFLVGVCALWPSMSDPINSASVSNLCIQLFRRGVAPVYHSTHIICISISSYLTCLSYNQHPTGCGLGSLRSLC